MIAQPRNRRGQNNSSLHRVGRHGYVDLRRVHAAHSIPEIPVDARVEYAASDRSDIGSSGSGFAPGGSAAPGASKKRGPSTRAAFIRNVSACARLFKGDWLVVRTFLACFAVLSVAGVLYFAIWANVAYEAAQVRSEQSKLNASTARQHYLLDQIGRLSSPDLIAAIAPSMNMELPKDHAYVDVPVPAAPEPVHAAIVASAAN
jgi:hypothetical protein